VSDQQQYRRRRGIRAGTFVGLLAVSALVLPLSAYAVEAVSTRAENWIAVVYLAVMTLLGAGLGAALHERMTPGGSQRRTVVTWAVMGLVAGLVGFVLWVVTVSG
jgi:hypothetical protein